MNARLTNRTRSTLLTPDWITVRGASPVSTIVQAPESWADTSGYGDATFYLEVAEVTAPTGASAGLVLIQIETSPTADEALFVPVAGPVVAAVSSAPTIMKSASAGTLPIARFVRWKVICTASGSFDVTFRLRMTCNRQTYFAPSTFGGAAYCSFWVRADLGLTVNNATVTGWANQQTGGFAAQNLVAGGPAGSGSNPGITAKDSNYNNQQTLSFSMAAGCFFTSGSWGVSAPATWVLVGHRTNSSQVNYFIDGNNAAAGSDQSVFGQGPAGGSVTTVNAGNALTFANPWTTPSAVLVEFNGASGNIFFNNFTTASASGNDGTNTLNGLSVGTKDPNAGGGSLWLGTIAEIMAFQGILTTSMKSMLRTYLNNRYALGIT